MGLPLADLAERTRGVRYDFEALGAQPRRLLTSPCWSGIANDGRAYTAYAQNVERLVPWRTLTGRQHLYLDHEAYRAFGESLPTFKPKIDVAHSRYLVESQPTGQGPHAELSSRRTASGTSTRPTTTRCGCSRSRAGSSPSG